MSAPKRFLPKRGGVKLLPLLLLVALALPAMADEQPPAKTEAPILILDRGPIVRVVSQAGDTVGNLVSGALDLIGIRYRRGGTSPDTGFDCSGFVSHVFRKTLGLILPHSAREIAKSGEKVRKDELQPGDLVFFNTMRRTFSHVGIYLGEHLFVHAPASGGEVRVEDMRTSYWSKRFTGARRIDIN